MIFVLIHSSDYINRYCSVEPTTTTAPTAPFETADAAEASGSGEAPIDGADGPAVAPVLPPPTPVSNGVDYSWLM